MNDDRVTVDELLFEIADYANNDQEIAVEKLSGYARRATWRTSISKTVYTIPGYRNAHEHTCAIYCYTSGSCSAPLTSTDIGIRMSERCASASIAVASRSVSGCP